MKMAKLPTGRVLKFPDETPDEAIDATVKEHLKKFPTKVLNKREEKDNDKKVSEARHQEIMNALTGIAQLHALHLETIHNSHTQILGALGHLSDVVSRPKKKRLIKDEQGKPIGAEEYV